MINRMSIEKLAYNIMKRAIADSYIAPLYEQERNEHNLHEDFKELAERLGYKVEKMK